jgi:ketosteroid isomerase-like protein
VLAAFPGSTAVADDKSEIISLQDSLETALNNFDVDKTLALLDDDFVLINIPGTVTTGMDGIRAYFEMMVLGNDAYLKGARFEMHIEGEPLIRDGRFAFIHGSAINYYQFSVGGTLDLPTFWSATLVKDEGGWKISSLHISGNVFNNPLLDELYWIVLVVLISAVSITGTGAYMLARKYRKSG